MRARNGRRATTAVAAALALVVVSGCVADPAPPTVVGEERSDGEAARLTGAGVLLALDRVDDGFNPHLISDQGVDTDLVASLLLPSTFIPGPDGNLELNEALLVSAEPLPDDPRTIRYTIDQRAQWSDGVPVAAEDFEYLWQQMTTQPGVVDPAAYDQIVDVRSGAGGKVVDVVFASSPDRWRTLFSDLLPAHILKDAPDGFNGAMAHLPVMSAGPFMVRGADIGRGEIEFVRNDRYWAQAPDLNQIIVRRATGAGQLGAALRNGPGTMALVASTPLATDVAETIPGIDHNEVDGALQLELGFNTVAPVASDLSVRRAVVAAVAPDVVGRIVTGESNPTVTRFPFPDSAPPLGTDSPAAVERELTDAGYVHDGLRWERDGTPLSVTLGVEAEDDRSITAAYTVSDQLRAAGIGARVWELDANALYADALPHGLVDGVVGWQRVDGDPEIAVVSRFACAPTGAAAPSRPPTTVSSLVPPEPDTGATAQPDATTSETTSATPSPTRTIGTDAPARTSGVSGVCDPELDRLLGGALEGAQGGAPGGATNDDDGVSHAGVDLPAAGTLVAEKALRIPLVQPSYLLARDSVDIAPGTDSGEWDADSWTLSDLFNAVPDWRRGR